MASAILVKNANLYTPEPRGIQDILIVNQTIVKIAPQLDPSAIELPLTVINANGRKVVPGYVDQHVHIIGGGGESGPYSRTPEMMLTDITTAGVTTLVGVLGTDGTSRHSETLLAKARGMTHEGITAYMLTGSY